MASLPIIRTHVGTTNNFKSRSGVKLNPQCVPVFEQMKIERDISYVIYTLTEDRKEIIVEKTSKSESYDDFLADLPEMDCRYAVYDFPYDLGGGEGRKNKLLFFTWCVHSFPTNAVQRGT